VAKKWRIARRISLVDKVKLVNQRCRYTFKWKMLPLAEGPALSKDHMKKAYKWCKRTCRTTKAAWRKLRVYIDLKRHTPRCSALAKRESALQDKDKEYCDPKKPKRKRNVKAKKSKSHTDGGHKSIVVMGCYANGKKRFALRVNRTVPAKERDQMLKAWRTQKERIKKMKPGPAKTAAKKKNRKPTKAMLYGNWCGKVYRTIIKGPLKKAYRQVQAENPGKRVLLVRDNDSVFNACAADEAAAGLKVDPLPTKRSMLMPLDYAHHPQIDKKIKQQERDGGMKAESYKKHQERVLRAYNFPKATIDNAHSAMRKRVAAVVETKGKYTKFDVS